MCLTLNHTAITRRGGIGERRIGLPRHDSEALFPLTLESCRLDCERRCATRAVLRCAGEGYRVFVAGNEADALNSCSVTSVSPPRGVRENAATLGESTNFLRPATP